MAEFGRSAIKVAQAAGYLIVLCGSVTLVAAMGLEFQSMPDKNCLLYTNFLIKGNFELSEHSKTHCHYIISVSCIAAAYAVLALVVCLVYLCSRSKADVDLPNLPFCLVNTIMTFAFLVAASLVSAGLSEFCSSFVDIQNNHFAWLGFNSCSKVKDYGEMMPPERRYLLFKYPDGAPFTWRDFSFYQYIHVVELCIWPTFSVILLLTVFNWVRFYLSVRRGSGAFDRQKMVNEIPEVAA